MSEWQPIETAPTDKRIWLFVPEYPAPANQMLIGLWEQENSWWGVEHATIRHVGAPFQYRPTHWMPMPKPPKMENDQ